MREAAFFFFLLLFTSIHVYGSEAKNYPTVLDSNFSSGDAEAMLVSKDEIRLNLAVKNDKEEKIAWWMSVVFFSMIVTLFWMQRSKIAEISGGALRLKPIVFEPKSNNTSQKIDHTAPITNLSVKNSENTQLRRNERVIKQSKLNEEGEECRVLDYDGALLRMGGNEALLLSMIQSFIEDVPILLSRLKEAMTQGDFDTVRTHAYSFKGSSSNIGAVALQEISKKIERAADENNGALVADLFPVWENVLNDTLVYLEKNVLHKEVDEMLVGLDGGGMIVQLQELRQSIIKNLFIDTDSSGIFGEYNDSDVATLIGQLKKSVDRFEYEKALELIAQLEEMRE